MSAPTPISARGVPRSEVEPAASLVRATKVFGGTTAIAEVSFDLRAGEVLALLGENGAGKSTCVKLLAGVYRPTHGHVAIDGLSQDFAGPLGAQRAGVAVMHQHPGLFGDLSVIENLFVGLEADSPAWRVDRPTRRRKAESLVETVGLDCDLEAPLSRLRTSEQQLVEIARALSRRARVLIMDEPTAALSQREVERLFSVVADLKIRGVAMMFVGHRMDEIYRVADRIAVLRDGRLVGTEFTRDLPRERAIQMMVGRPLDGLYPKSSAKIGDVVLRVRDLSRRGAFDDVSFDLRSGEILGLGGLVGSGRTEVARVLFGVDAPTSGAIEIGGRPIDLRSPGDAMRHGVAYVSEDRIGQSLVMDFSILANASLTVLEKVRGFLLVSRSLELAVARPHLDRLRLRFRSFDQPVRMLSGGNQQKVVLSKWLASDPKILILDEPTQGIDVQTKADVHAMMIELAAKGIAIVLISSELPELLGMSDRILVLREGRIEARFEREDATQEKVIRAATATSAHPREKRVVALRPASEMPAPEDAQTIDGQARKRRVFGREIGLVAAIAAVVVPAAVLNPRMLSPANLEALSMDLALLTIVTAAQMLVVITRNIDLSVASIIGLCAYGAASTIHAHPQIGVAGALFLSCLIGLGCGFVNGLVVTIGRVPAIVVTLGTMSIFRGVDSLWTGGKQISADQVPQAWLDMTSYAVAGVPALVFIAAGILIVIAYCLQRLSIGRELFAIGSNPDGARLIGIPVRRRVLLAFVVAGALAGIDGALWASRYATIDARVASGFELTVIASMVVGGVAIRGGSGTVAGVALGSLTLLAIRNALTLVRVDPLWLQGVYGLVILLAVAVDAYVARRASASWARTR